MIRSACLLLLALAASLVALGQEVVVFSDQRSLVVASHREQGSWTYLKMDGGEIAVKTGQIAQIRKEGAEAQQSARAVVAASPPPVAGGPPPGSARPAPSRPAPPPPPDEDDDEEPPAPAEPQRPQPPRGMGVVRTLRPGSGVPPPSPGTKRQGGQSRGGALILHPLRGGVFLTLDVEAWFHHPGHTYGRDRGLWDTLPSRIPDQVAAAFELLDTVGSRATCFFLGWVARRYPGTVREAARRGHEVACHGTDHRPVREMDAGALREDLSGAKALLEDLAGIEVRGFRAPAWSIHGAPWAYEVLAECGFGYSSSRLLIPGLDRKEALGGGVEGVLEIPALASPWHSAPFPAGGTVALRTLPLRMLESCRDETLASGRPAVYWFHPWELDLASPVLPGLSAPARFQRYGFLDRLPGRIAHLAGGVRRTMGEAAVAWREVRP